MTRSERKSYSLREIAERFGGNISGDPEIEVRQVATLQNATAGSIAFLANERYLPQLKTTRAGAVILGESVRDATRLPRIICGNPYVICAVSACSFRTQRSTRGPASEGRQLGKSGKVKSGLRGDGPTEMGRAACRRGCYRRGVTLGAGSSVSKRTIYQMRSASGDTPLRRGIGGRIRHRDEEDRGQGAANSVCSDRQSGGNGANPRWTAGARARLSERGGGQAR